MIGRIAFSGWWRAEIISLPGAGNRCLAPQRGAGALPAAPRGPPETPAIRPLGQDCFQTLNNSRTHSLPAGNGLAGRFAQRRPFAGGAFAVRCRQAVDMAQKKPGRDQTLA